MTTVPPVIAPLSTEARGRHERLGAAIGDSAGGRPKAGGRDQSKALMLGGAVGVPAGLVLILLGWSGVAHTTDVFEQMPYFVSGGVLGLALVFAGGFAYFGYWLTQLVYAVRKDAADNREVLGQISELLATNAAATSVALARLATTGPAANNGRRPLRAAEKRPMGTLPAAFLVTAQGTVYHRSDCAVVAGIGSVRSATGQEPDLSACQICQPA